MNLKVITNWIKVGLLAIIIVVVALKSVHTTGTTDVGVRTVKWSLFGNSGVETNKVYQPGGTYFLPPFFNEFNLFDARLQIVEMTATINRGDKMGVDDLPFKTRDGNDLRIDVTFKYRIDPKRTPYIREFVASDMLELKEKIVRTVARSKTRDYLGAYSTEEFYQSTNRNQSAEDAKAGLQKVLDQYGVIVEDVNLMDYRFDPEYQKVITDKKIADAKTTALISQATATVEMNKKLLNDALSAVNNMRAEADGKYQEAVLSADAYYMQQTNSAAATIAEGEAEAAGITKMREAMNNVGSLIQVKMAIADSLENKRIVMVPTGGTGALNLQTLDVNEVLRQLGLAKPK
jgi:regulator of protease activity HflC (stomatin/prohibitin superfamily)